MKREWLIVPILVYILVTMASAGGDQPGWAHWLLLGATLSIAAYVVLRVADRRRR
jgi:hypothetical protein